MTVKVNNLLYCGEQSFNNISLSVTPKIGNRLLNIRTRERFIVTNIEKNYVIVQRGVYPGPVDFMYEGDRIKEDKEC